MALAASSFRSLASRPSTSWSPPCTWPNTVIAKGRLDCFASLAMTEIMETHHVERNSPRHHRPGPADADHGPCLPTRDDRDRGRDLPETGAGQPDRKGRQGGRLRADRAGVQGRQIFPRPALGDDGAGPG